MPTKMRREKHLMTKLYGFALDLVDAKRGRDLSSALDWHLREANRIDQKDLEVTANQNYYRFLTDLGTL